MKKKVLFVSENITLAQIVRLLALARRLPRECYEVHFASGPGHDWLFPGAAVQRWPLFTLDGGKGLARLAAGKRLYERATLQRYVQDELRIIDAVEPDVVIGDFRLTLAVSARLAGVKCASLINAYWSPFAVRESFPVPDHPMVRLLGLELAERYFPQAMPHVFAHFAAPLNVVRKQHGLSAVSLLEQLCFGDAVLYPDIPELCPLLNAPASHHFLGAIPWAPDVPLPGELEANAVAPPLVYVTLGSSGDTGALPAVLAGLAELPIRGVLATAGKPLSLPVPGNFRAFDYLPGDAVAKRARLVVTNGGSSTGYQALAAGTPVLGIASNLDQYLATQSITRAGAGVLLRAASVQSEQVRAAASELCANEDVRRNAAALERAFAAVDCHSRFQTWLAAAVALVVMFFARATVAEENVAINVIEFETQNRNDAGVVRCGLFRQDGWLKTAFRAAVVKVRGKRALCVFKEVPAGTYGISAFHDEDNDGELDTNFVGYPTEEYCSSRNARNLMSAPSWSDAKFSYRGSTVRLRAIMK